MDDFTMELEALSHRVLNKDLPKSALPKQLTEPVEDLNEKEVVLYQTEDGNMIVSVYYYDETFWLTQRAMAELFNCSSDNISLHLKNIYRDGELQENLTTEFFSVVQKEGARNVSRKMKYYNLDAIIVRRHIVGGINSTLFSVVLPPRLCSHVGNRRLSPGQPHTVVALFERQDSCF